MPMTRNPDGDGMGKDGSDGLGKDRVEIFRGFLWSENNCIMEVLDVFGGSEICKFAVFWSGWTTREVVNYNS